MADVDITLRLKAFGDGTGLEEVDGLTAGVECGGVAVLEADVIKVRIEGDALELQDGTSLVGSGERCCLGRVLTGVPVGLWV